MEKRAEECQDAAKEFPVIVKAATSKKRLSTVVSAQEVAGF